MVTEVHEKDLPTIMRRRPMAEATATFLARLVNVQVMAPKLTNFLVVVYRRLKIDPHIVAYALCLLLTVRATREGSLSSQNVKRYFFTSLLVAHNMLTDTPYDLPSWSLIVEESYSVDEIALMEITYLGLINWQTHVQNNDVTQMLVTLIRIYNTTIPPGGTIELPVEFDKASSDESPFSTLEYQPSSSSLVS